MEEYEINNKDTHALIVVSYFLLPQEKKAVFKGFQITWYNMYNSTVSRKNVQKKVTTIMVEFNNKVLNV